jgi:hypothetical protein
MEYDSATATLRIDLLKQGYDVPHRLSYIWVASGGIVKISSSYTVRTNDSYGRWQVTLASFPENVVKFFEKTRRV